jgi:hypothetical protein
VGCYDTVTALCPRCKQGLHFQSKGGRCEMVDYTLADAPDDVMSNVNRHAPFGCKCGALVEVDVARRRVVECATSPFASVPSPPEYAQMARLLAYKLSTAELQRLSELTDGPLAEEVRKVLMPS